MGFTIVLQFCVLGPETSSAPSAWQGNPELSQRQLAGELGVSLGGVNFH